MRIRDRIKELRRVKADRLRPHPKNWRTHPQRQQDALRGILAEIGYADALLARELPDGSLELIDGHLRATSGLRAQRRVALRACPAAIYRQRISRARTARWVTPTLPMIPHPARPNNPLTPPIQPSRLGLGNKRKRAAVGRFSVWKRLSHTAQHVSARCAARRPPDACQPARICRTMREHIHRLPSDPCDAPVGLR